MSFCLFYHDCIYILFVSCEGDILYYGSQLSTYYRVNGCMIFLS